jgi:Mitochondrial domain of unknown function (DUF1713)
LPSTDGHGIADLAVSGHSVRSDAGRPSRPIAAAAGRTRADHLARCPAWPSGHPSGTPGGDDVGSRHMGSVIKKRRKRMAKKKHRKLLKKTRVQRRNKK